MRRDGVDDFDCEIGIFVETQYGEVCCNRYDKDRPRIFLEGENDDSEQKIDQDRDADDGKKRDVPIRVKRQ
ncbi:hypothetical protein [Bradyrhizobium sp.]|uniref:hypothetical protein n=1 Tax=Bradyrhizobium sp. TaxID=376 RepID=UPI003C4B8003